MAEWTDDIGAYLVAEGVGVLATNIYISSKAPIPPGDGPFLSIIETGGSGPDRTQNSVLQNAYENPSAQILVRGKSYVAARAKLRLAYNAFVKVRNQTINGTWYLWMRPQQEFIDLGLDETGRARVAFNVFACKRP